MYTDIGKKIKGLTKAVVIIGIILCFIIGIVIMTSDEDLIGIGLLVMVAGALVFWLSSWLLYGYGELIDKVSDIERNTRLGGRVSDVQAKVDSERIRKAEFLRSQNLITEEEFNQILMKENRGVQL